MGSSAHAPGTEPIQSIAAIILKLMIVRIAFILLHPMSPYLHQKSQPMGHCLESSLNHPLFCHDLSIPFLWPHKNKMAMGLSTHGHFPCSGEAWSRVPPVKIKRKKAICRKHLSLPHFRSFGDTTHPPSLSRAIEKKVLPGNIFAISYLLARNHPTLYYLETNVKLFKRKL
jgi:hypothetical protein